MKTTAPISWLRCNGIIASAENQKARLPQLTYRDRLTIHLGGKEIQILYLGRGHTRGDSILFVPQDRIAYVSELFFSDQFLYINDSYGRSWLKTLDAIEALPADVLVPGHGPIPQDPTETRQSLHRFRQILVNLQDAVQEEIARGGKPPPRSSFPSTKSCRDTDRKEKSPYGACTKN